MEPSSGTLQKQLLNTIFQATEKSMQVNLKYIQDVSQLFSNLAERPLDLSDETGGRCMTLNQALTAYMATSTAYASQLLNLGIEVTEEFFGNFNPMPKYKAREQSRTQVFDLNISGPPGTLCQTAFVLGNHQSQPIRAKFNYSMLIDAAGEQALDVPIQFNPSMVKLEHRGDKRRIIVRLKLPHDINFGLYHTFIMIEGMPELKYRLMVTVEKPLPVKPKSENQNQASKRTSGKSRKTGAKRKKSLTRE